MINIRKATKEDVAYIAEGIYHAFLLEDKALYNQWIRTLKEVCVQEDTHYSYKNTWIAEVDRKIAEADGERVEPTNPAKKLYRKLGFAYQRGIEIFNEEYELYAAEIVV